MSSAIPRHHKGALEDYQQTGANAVKQPVSVIIRITVMMIVIGLLLTNNLLGNIYLEIPTIPGDTNTKEHDRWIEIQSVISGITLERPEFTRTLKAQHKDIQLSKQADRSTPDLIRALTSAEQLHDLTIDVTKWTGNQGELTFLTYKLRTALLSAWDLSLEEDDNTLMEHFGLQYDLVEWHYQEINEDGSINSSVEAWWDIEQNAGGGGSSGGGSSGGGSGGGSGNSAPTIQYIPGVILLPGEGTSVDVIINDTDNSPDSLLVTVSTNRPDLIKDLSLSGTGTNRSLSFNTSSLYSGLAGITLRVSDGLAVTSFSFAALIDVEATPFETFMATYFTLEELGNNLICSPVADPDHDTLATVIEYALGTNPREFTSGKDVIHINRISTEAGNFFELTYRCRNDDPNVRAIPWMSPETLGNFSSLLSNPFYVESSTVSDNPLYDDVTGVVDIGDGSIDKYFFRIQVIDEQ